MCVCSRLHGVPAVRGVRPVRTRAPVGVSGHEPPTQPLLHSELAQHVSYWRKGHTETEGLGRKKKGGGGIDKEERERERKVNRIGRESY